MVDSRSRNTRNALNVAPVAARRTGIVATNLSDEITAPVTVHVFIYLQRARRKFPRVRVPVEGTFIEVLLSRTDLNCGRY